MAQMKSEQVKFGDLKPNSAFYLIDPLTVQAPAYAPPNYTGSTALDPDALVWVVYEAWLRSGNPYVKKA